MRRRKGKPRQKRRGQTQKEGSPEAAEGLLLSHPLATQQHSSRVAVRFVIRTGWLPPLCSTQCMFEAERRSRGRGMPAERHHRAPEALNHESLRAVSSRWRNWLAVGRGPKQTPARAGEKKNKKGETSVEARAESSGATFGILISIESTPGFSLCTVDWHMSC